MPAAAVTRMPTTGTDRDGLPASHSRALATASWNVVTRMLLGLRRNMALTCDNACPEWDSNLLTPSR